MLRFRTSFELPAVWDVRTWLGLPDTETWRPAPARSRCEAGMAAVRGGREAGTALESVTARIFAFWKRWSGSGWVAIRQTSSTAGPQLDIVEGGGASG